jgi:hypothetical protein
MSLHERVGADTLKKDEPVGMVRQPTCSEKDEPVGMVGADML